MISRRFPKLMETTLASHQYKLTITSRLKKKWKADIICPHCFHGSLNFNNLAVNVHLWRRPMASGPHQVTENFSSPVPLLLHRDGQVENHSAAWHANQHFLFQNTHTHLIQLQLWSWLTLPCISNYPPWSFPHFVVLWPGTEMDFIVILYQEFTQNSSCCWSENQYHFKK